MKSAIFTILLLVISNVFMTFAWYGNLRLQQSGVSSNWPLYLVILASWGVALIEYCFMIPANRIGFDGNGGPFSLFQLKIIQEALSLIVFTIIAVLMFQGQKFHWKYVVSFVLILGAVFFAFLPTKSVE